MAKFHSGTFNSSSGRWDIQSGFPPLCSRCFSSMFFTLNIWELSRFCSCFYCSYDICDIPWNVFQYTEMKILKFPIPSWQHKRHPSFTNVSGYSVKVDALVCNTSDDNFQNKINKMMLWSFRSLFVKLKDTLWGQKTDTDWSVVLLISRVNMKNVLSFFSNYIQMLFS